MTKSIESIWKEGFIDEMALVAPKVNDLYNQKSQNLVDKFEAMFAVNHKAIIIAAIAFVSGLSYFGFVALGVFISLMLLGLVAIGKLQTKELARINKDDSSLAYLTAFDLWLDKCIAQYIKVYRVFYPSAFLACAITFFNSDTGKSISAELATEFTVWNMPIPVLLFISIIALILGITGGAIYRADLNMTYGNEIQKLKQLISDMKSLGS
jgi:hypothetical protein